MKSISRKFLGGTLSWLFILVALMTVVSIVAVNRISDSDSETIITQACENETLRLNNEFSLLENSVTDIYVYVKDLEAECADESEMLSDDFCTEVQSRTIGIANRTDGAMAVYFRYDPELTGNGTAGFFWSRDNDDEEFSCCEPTDILQYDRNDTDHVGWYYEPKEKGVPMWMTPYYNKNLDVFMISYVIPYYTESGNFLGVIGMDIDFSKIVGLTGQVSLYKTGRVYLADLSDYYMYGTDRDGNITFVDLTMDVYNLVTTINRGSDTLILTDDNGQNNLTCVGQLSNGMRLMMYIPTNEINAQRNTLLIIFAVIAAASVAAAVFFVVRLTDRIVRPLKTLTRITRRYANGDWNETFISRTGDEIQELSESITVMAETTKSYINRIHQYAETDALTGLKNKNRYLSWIEKYRGSCAPKEYGVAAFDLNFLKKINDTYGHEAGDELIRNGGKYICNTFKHSPVFRIGGDEFVALLENSDYADREALYRRFMDGMKDLPPAAEGIPLSLACGIAVFPADGADFDTVFNCADERMYECKKQMKAVRDD